MPKIMTPELKMELWEWLQLAMYPLAAWGGSEAVAWYLDLLPYAF